MGDGAAWITEAVRGLGAALVFLVLFLAARYRWRERGGGGSGDSGLD